MDGRRAKSAVDRLYKELMLFDPKQGSVQTPGAFVGPCRVHERSNLMAHRRSHQCD